MATPAWSAQEIVAARWLLENPNHYAAPQLLATATPNITALYVLLSVEQMKQGFVAQGVAPVAPQGSAAAGQTPLQNPSSQPVPRVRVSPASSRSGSSTPRAVSVGRNPIGRPPIQVHPAAETHNGSSTSNGVQREQFPPRGMVSGAPMDATRLAPWDPRQTSLRGRVQPAPPPSTGTPTRVETPYIQTNVATSSSFAANRPRPRPLAPRTESPVSVTAPYHLPPHVSSMGELASHRRGLSISTSTMASTVASTSTISTSPLKSTTPLTAASLSDKFVLAYMPDPLYKGIQLTVTPVKVPSRPESAFEYILNISTDDPSQYTRLDELKQLLLPRTMGTLTQKSFAQAPILAPGQPRLKIKLYKASTLEEIAHVCEGCIATKMNNAAAYLKSLPVEQLKSLIRKHPINFCKTKKGEANIELERDYEGSSTSFSKKSNVSFYIHASSLNAKCCPDPKGFRLFFILKDGHGRTIATQEAGPFHNGRKRASTSASTPALTDGSYATPHGSVPVTPASYPTTAESPYPIK